MKLVLALVALATVLVLVGGVGFIAARIADAETARLVFMAVLVGGAGVTLLSLTVALIVGFYHLYLYWFTDRRPLSLFATTKRNASDQ
jgi:hypothetical protein